MQPLRNIELKFILASFYTIGFFGVIVLIFIYPNVESDILKMVVSQMLLGLIMIIRHLYKSVKEKIEIE